MDINWLAYLAAAYLLGAAPFGLLVSRLFGGPDPRTKGSQNIGATNVARLSGLPAGVTTLVLDVAKGFVPASLAYDQLGLWPAVLSGLAAFCGHLWPVYLGFKGGKGVATAIGVILAWSPLACLGTIAVFGLSVWLKGYVSLGSMLGCASAPLWMLALGKPLPLVAAGLVMALLVLWRHRQNIARLQQGSEPSLKGGLS